MNTKTDYISTIDKHKQIQLDKLIESYDVYVVGAGYVDLIIHRDRYSNFIDELSVFGLVIESISWWCNATENNKSKYGCPHGFGGPMTKYGWVSEISHEYDDLESEIPLAQHDDFNQDSVREINNKAKNIIKSKQTAINSDGSFLTFKDNPCLTPGLCICVPDNWIR